MRRLALLMLMVMVVSDAAQDRRSGIRAERPVAASVRNN
jgi:hypothetical protein